MDRTGTLVWSVGEHTSLVYPRSGLKYFQILPLLLSGAAESFCFTDEELCVMCASHNGELKHLAVVKNILRKIGLTEGDLRCGTHFPLGFEAGEAVLRRDGDLSQLHNNCSGKHAGFLAYCVFHKLDHKTYLSPEHPLQVAIRAELSHFSEYPQSSFHFGVDGCSAPAYALPLSAVATAFSNLSKINPCPQREAARRHLVRAVTENPFFVAGSGRFCTALMNARPGRFLGKLGADGFYALSLLEEGFGLAVKMDDGALGPQYNLVAAILIKLGLLDKEKEKGGPLGEFISTKIKTALGVWVGSREAVMDELVNLEKVTRA